MLGSFFRKFKLQTNPKVIGFSKNLHYKDDKISKADSNICFIIGCQRSGTTMMRLVLETHPELVCYEEPTSYNYWADRSLLENEIVTKSKEGKRVFVFKTPCLTEQFNNTDGIAKELRHKKFPFSFRYDNQLLIFMVRDPRDDVYR